MIFINPALQIITIVFTSQHILTYWVFTGQILAMYNTQPPGTQPAFFQEYHPAPNVLTKIQYNLTLLSYSLMTKGF